METESALDICPHCLTEVPDKAKICTGCGATRRSATYTTWTSPREGRRNDIMLGGIGLVAVAFVLLFVFTTLYAMWGPKSTSATRTGLPTPSAQCDPYDYKSNWPNC